MTGEIERIAAGLIPLERERLTGWQGVAGAAYNVISVGLCKMGLLNCDWSLSERGEQVRAHLEQGGSVHESAVAEGDAP